MFKNFLFKSLIFGGALILGLSIQSGHAMDAPESETDRLSPIILHKDIVHEITKYVDIGSMRALACSSKELYVIHGPKVLAIQSLLNQECLHSFKDLHYFWEKLLSEPSAVIVSSGYSWKDTREINADAFFVDKDGFYDIDTFLRYDDARLRGNSVKISFYRLDAGSNALEALDISEFQKYRCFYQTKRFQPDSAWGQKITKAKFTPQGIEEELPICISQLRNLQDLKVSHISWVHPWIRNLEMLTKLTFVNSYVSELPESFVKLSSLKVLDLSSNNQLRKLPESFGGLHSLEELYLQKNRLTCLPASMGELTSLKILDLSDNLLEKVPALLKPNSGQLQSLKTLNLSGNLIASNDINGLISVCCSCDFDDEGHIRFIDTQKLDLASSLVAHRALAARLFSEY